MKVFLLKYQLILIIFGVNNIYLCAGICVVK